MRVREHLRGRIVFLFWAVVCLSQVQQTLSVGGFHHFKVGSFFEGMLPTFGVKVNPDAFSVTLRMFLEHGP